MLTDEEPDGRREAPYPPELARRHLRASILIVSAMAIAAFMLGFAMPVNPLLDGSTIARDLLAP
ncbi:hypothetical protein ACNHKD_05915 [Methylocystis sp. JAN1]|uniref:hypothetical protein n=1 Tax=Methylocystis sp. JAN1 TaxID=3397211 RepID=UPI003FA33F89